MTNGSEGKEFTCTAGVAGSMEKGMATHSIFLAWRIPRPEEQCGLQSMGVAKSRTRLSDYFKNNSKDSGMGP